MARIHFDDHAVALNGDETALDGLLRAGVSMPHACRQGVCQSCLARVLEGQPPAGAQRGLNDRQVAAGLILTCQCRPTADLRLGRPTEAVQEMTATVTGKRWLGPDVLELRLQPAEPLDYRAGQFITLLREDGLARSYSLASVPGLDEALHLHVRVLPQGAMSAWLAWQVEEGATLRLRGPMGRCYYLPGQPERPTLLVGVGTGLAPLWGVARDALHQGHRGPVVLVAASSRPEGFYLSEPLQALRADNPQLHVTQLLREGPDDPSWEVADLAAWLGAHFQRLVGWEIFLCGDAQLVRRLQRQVFLAGAGARDIHIDAFVPAA